LPSEGYLRKNQKRLDRSREIREFSAVACWSVLEEVNEIQLTMPRAVEPVVAADGTANLCGNGETDGKESLWHYSRRQGSRPLCFEEQEWNEGFDYQLRRDSNLH